MTTFVTEIVAPALAPSEVPNTRYAALLEQRIDSADAWVEEHASGTLRKNKKLGFAWTDQYLHERVAYEFGWAFELLPASRVTCGRPYTEGDCKAITEAGWHIERYLTRQLFAEDSFIPAYLQAEYADGTKKEGIGLFVAKTSASWVGSGKAVFAVVAEFDAKSGVWLDAVNPF